MADLLIRPSKLRGDVHIPPSKSHTLRALFFALMAKGRSEIKNFLPSPDTFAMLKAIQALGARVEQKQDLLSIEGVAGQPQIPKDVIDCGNSGQILRFIGALASLIPGYTILTGDLSIRQNRPAKPLLDALHQLGAFAESSQQNGQAPLIIKGPITKDKASLCGSDSQPVSGLLMTAAFAPHPIELSVTDPKETPWIDLTLSWLKKFNISYQMQDYRRYRVSGPKTIDAFSYQVPGDWSTASYPLTAALLTGSEITLHNLDIDDSQGDKALLFALEKMGARFEILQNAIRIKKSPPLQGAAIDVDLFIDALPLLSVIGCFAQEKIELSNGWIARKKESDRILTIALELKKMGAQIEEKPDGLIIYPSKLKGCELNSHEDHRIALALSVAALGAEGPSAIKNTDCIKKTYPDFKNALLSMGAQIE